MARALGILSVILLSQLALAGPPDIAKITKCPEESESPRPGFCCRRGTVKPGLQKDFGVDVHCVFHGPVVYGNLNHSRFSILGYEFGRLDGPRWEIVDGKIHTMQEFTHSTRTGVYHEYDRQGRLRFEGTKDQGELTGVWKVHLHSQQKSYLVDLSSETKKQRISLCPLNSSKCTPAQLTSQEQTKKIKPKITRVLNLYQPHLNQFPFVFQTSETNFLPLRTQPDPKAPLLGVIIKNRLITQWTAFMPFTYFDRELGYIPVAQQEKGHCLVQILPKPYPWVWIPCPNQGMNLEKQILSYKWARPVNIQSVRSKLAGKATKADSKIHAILEKGLLTIHPLKLVVHNNRQWIEGQLTDYAKQLGWPILDSDRALRESLKVKAYHGKTVFFPLVDGNYFNFYPMEHN